MQTVMAFLCDAAAESGGKLYALGIGVDRLQVRDLPARHGRLTFVARIRIHADEQGAHAFRVRLIEADGRDVISPVSGELTVPIPERGTGVHMNLIIDLVNVDFRSEGPHELTLAIDESQVVALPLDVALVTS